MHLYPYKIHGNQFPSRWVNNTEIINQKKKNNLFIVYIGRSANNYKSIAEHFRVAVSTDSYKIAETTIAQSITDENKTPDAIFIDLPLVRSDLKEFMFFLTQTGLSQSIPILYNQIQLSHLGIKFLRSTSCIDDIINFSSTTINFRNKIFFLQQVKELHHDCDYSKIIPQEKTDLVQLLSDSLKRSFDIAIALMALLFALPIFLIIALAIKIESRRPGVLYFKTGGTWLQDHSFL